jgi:hypothetical protein
MVANNNNARPNYSRALRRGYFDTPNNRNKKVANYRLTLKLPCFGFQSQNHKRSMPKYTELMEILDESGVMVTEIATTYEVTYRRYYLVEFKNERAMLHALQQTVAMGDSSRTFQHINSSTILRKLEGIQAVTPDEKIAEAINAIPNLQYKSLKRHRVPDVYTTKSGVSIQPYTGRVIVEAYCNNNAAIPDISQYK